MAKESMALNLEQFRKSSGVPLERISEETKIGTNFLRAIESEEFEKLPGGIFNTSYIRQYARAIGFDEVELLAVYHERTAAVEAEREQRLQPVQPASGLRSYVNWLRIPPTLIRS